MRVLLADKLAPLVPGRLQDLGAQVTVDPGLSGDALTARLAEVDPAVLVVRSTKVTAADVDAARSLSLIIRAGAGVNTIDLAAASGRGVYVANCPGKNACAVAELAIGHLINLDRRIADNVRELREGRWNKKGFGGAPGLNGRLLAVLGVGTIGTEVVRRAQALGMRVRAWSRSLTDASAEALGVERAETPEQAVKDADAVTVHLALTPETTGRVGQSIFDAMKPGAYFINTARGEVVDEKALARALDEKGVRAGLDVFCDEPAAKEGAFEHALAGHPNVYGTHHIGASTVEATEAVGEEVVRIVDAFASGRVIPNCVNLASESEATHNLVVRHADRVGVLAGVLDALRHAGINVQEMQNIVFSGGEAACARIEIVGEPDAATLEKVNAVDAVFDASVSPLE
ncbi:MAG TPA: NAD(P)-dependent oxidoreductase [Sandaracinaceae bacterium LLY-WYZ-13_1]|nr:NAD(P)-dependent oxidoreductase [Sandaracinaceae bacterium LLY-WYZ-13_1]